MDHLSCYFVAFAGFWGCGIVKVIFFQEEFLCS